MPELKSLETQRVTAKRFLKLTVEQWLSFTKTGRFTAKVYSSYSLRVNDVLFLTCKMDTIKFIYDPKIDVTVINVDETHVSVRNGGYNEVQFSIKDTPAQ